MDAVVMQVSQPQLFFQAVILLNQQQHFVQSPLLELLAAQVDLR